MKQPRNMCFVPISIATTCGWSTICQLSPQKKNFLVKKKKNTHTYTHTHTLHNFIPKYIHLLFVAKSDMNYYKIGIILSVKTKETFFFPLREETKQMVIFFYKDGH